MIRTFAKLEGARALDIGCGLGMYTRRLAEAGAQPLGLEIDWPRAREARASGLSIIAAVSERLPLDEGSLDLVLLHEVLEHVADDRATAAELARCLAPGGRAIIFVPNRWWPFETHGMFWRGAYRFGNIPLINYLPDPLRNRLAPHVRVYTRRSLREAFEGLPLRVVHHGCIYPGYDNLAARRPRLGGLARRLSYALERGPFERFGLSHLLVVERLGETTETSTEETSTEEL
jgi:SAM-dependent methyltransferase